MGAGDIFETLSKMSSIESQVFIIGGKNEGAHPIVHSRKMAQKAPKMWKLLELENLDEDEVIESCLIHFRMIS